ncbi:hypothetical protein BJ138DRAFT_1118827 [Hygrophoropsis aurantiaca]|uniref:Uncharacterized protein n=1 Tax=Hygrophoropsis aurantiaca TaxID=72124 RepID=A0ACB7ZWL9_9AGAM|nr:hypothetical protein BJ138DRAFT_1118827 [Hygrophoropsis aurantiaca]
MSEYVNSARECVTLESLSTETGNKDFTAIEMFIDHGEDLAVKGATYIFKIVEVVPDPSSSLKCWYLSCAFKMTRKALSPHDVASTDSSFHLWAKKRAFDLDERLFCVASLDVGVYMTSLHSQEFAPYR